MSRNQSFNKAGLGAVGIALTSGMLLGVPVLSPLAVPLAYRWPVTHIGPALTPIEAPEQPTLLLLHRAAEHRVQFKQISPAIYRLAVSLASNEWTGRKHLAKLAAEASLHEDALIEPGRGMLEQLRRDGIVLGTLS